MLWTKTTSGPSPAVWYTISTPSESTLPSVTATAAPRQSVTVTLASVAVGVMAATTTSNPHSILMASPFAPSPPRSASV